ncbi:hypothetical protein O1611_g3096 [Lasiodiplodia mahajangana]|uniref:Uncharacterized protein n=1 Tax=Lasiodiplodia mahajangana TaxID=1108764 RepID=A0ACC2JSQ8_9PEZI|nr:hypothetical protein O1611_g3096 [Lasiodiplodia mahajangana]
MADTFHPFPRLPVEIRLKIWALAAGPRNLKISRTPSAKWLPLGTTFAYASPNPPPAVMHVCREARQNAPYRKAFLTSAAAETKYIWVNFQNDMICLPDDQVRSLAPHYADIERLRLTAEADVEGNSFLDYFKHQSCWILKPFSALRVLHIAVEDDFLGWAESFMGEGYANCPSENVRFLDLHTGLLLTGPQLVMAHYWCLQNGGKVENMDDFDEELQFMIDNCTGLNLDELADVD